MYWHSTNKPTHTHKTHTPSQALNHVTGKVNVRLHHDAPRSVLQMVATESIPAGAEVVNCYGRLSNADLLREYGYVEAQNENEHAQVCGGGCMAYWVGSGVPFAAHCC